MSLNRLDLTAMRMASVRDQLKTTVLYRQGGQWQRMEINRLCNGLMTEVAEHPKHLEYVILLGHFTKEQTLKALLGGVAYTATQVTGMKSTELPFPPPFVV